jgi:hypothetical protein
MILKYAFIFRCYLVILNPHWCPVHFCSYPLFLACLAARFHLRNGPVHNARMKTVSSNLTFCKKVTCVLEKRPTFNFTFSFSMETAHSSEIAVNIYQTTRHRVSEIGTSIVLIVSTSDLHHELFRCLIIRRIISRS